MNARDDQTRWTISGFADEIGDDFETQLQVLQRLGVGWLDLRSAWGTNVTALDETQLAEVERLLQRYGIGVACIGSPIGKQAIGDDFEPHVQLFAHTLDLAERFGTRNIRIFSFFLPEGDDPASHRDEVLRRLSVLVEMAGARQVVLLHENEKEIYGDTAERCLDLLTELGSPSFRAILDPANFVQCGVDPLAAFELLADHVDYLHMKDAVAGTPQVVPVGQGDGRVPELLHRLNERGYRGFFALEPHLGAYDAFGAMSGPDSWQLAHRSLVELMDAELAEARSGAGR